MDVRQMRYLVAVAEELSFTRAAERCHVSQPPLSRAIQELEAEIGARLFERDKHNVSITPAGLSLVTDARRALALIDEGKERARRTAQGLRGTVSIGIGGSTVYSLLPMLVRRFREAVADVRISFHAMPVLRQIEALREGEIDIGILRLPIFDELIATRFVHHEPLVVCLPSGHPMLAHSGPVAIGDLADSRFVSYAPTRGFNVHGDLQALCRIAGFDPIIAHEAPTTEAVIGIVACGEGVAVVPASAERLRMRGAAFRPLDMRGLPTNMGRVEFALAWRRHDVPSAAAEFIERTVNAAGTDIA